MRPVDMLQLRVPGQPDRGDCLRACVASILELDPNGLPNFADEWPHSWLEWAGDRYELIEHKAAPSGWSIAVGVSPRDPQITHGVVALDGTIVHDPHPSRAGLTSAVQYWWTIERAFRDGEKGKTDGS